MATINDLLRSSLNQPVQSPSATLRPGQVPAATQAVGNTIGGLANTMLVPAKQLFQMPVSEQEQQSAEQGATDIFGGLSGNEFINPAMESALPAIQQAKGVVSDTIENIKGQPGGTQAGFAKIAPKEPTFNATNTWSQFIKNPKGDGVIKNPNYEPGTTVPSQFAQNTEAAQAETAQPGGLPPITTQAEPAPLTKAQIPQQPALTPAQLKAFKKSGLDQYRLPVKYGDKRATLEAIDKSVMANVVGGNSPEEVLQRLPSAEQNVWGQVTDRAAQVPAIDVDQKVLPYINAKLEDLVHQGIITDQQYKELSTGVATTVNDKAVSQLAGNKFINGQDLINLQTGANAKAPNMIPQGSNYVPYVNKAIADGYRDAIGNADPTIRYLYQQYSSMKRIGEMSDTFRTTAGQAPGILERLKQNPALTLGAGALALPEIIGGIKAVAPAIGTGLGLAQTGIKSAEDFIANSAGYIPKTNQTQAKQVNGVGGVPVGGQNQGQGQQDQSHGGIIAQPGRYSFQTPQQAGFLTTNDYTTQKNQLTQQIANEKLYNPQQANIDQGTLDQLDNSWNTQQPIRDKGTQVNTSMGLANAAFNIIQEADPSILNLNGSYDSLLKSSNPKYAALGKALQAIGKATGIDLSTAKTKEALVASLDYAIQSMQNDYNAQLQQFFGGGTLNQGQTTTNLPSIQATQNTTQGLPQTSKDASAIVGGSIPSLNLPPITQ